MKQSMATRSSEETETKTEQAKFTSILGCLSSMLASTMDDIHFLLLLSIKIRPRVNFPAQFSQFASIFIKPHLLSLSLNPNLTIFWIFIIRPAQKQRSHVTTLFICFTELDFNRSYMMGWGCHMEHTKLCEPNRNHHSFKSKEARKNPLTIR
jgi:hypothetical protein